MSALVISFALCLTAVPASPQDQPDFRISPAYLKFLSDAGIQPVLTMQMEARSGRVHLLNKDCELHIAATPQPLDGSPLGEPDAIVVEPPNMCKIPPPGVAENASEAKLRDQVWPQEIDDKVMHKTCEVRGFPRIFTEHASGGTEGTGANPNHVFEIHPALSIKCGDQELSFEKALTVFEGMTHIQPSTTKSCIEDRGLKVRFADGNYEFLETGSGRCGNFAIVEVGSIDRKFVQEIKGGHSAVARVSPDGQTRASLKIYTLASTAEDTWLASVKSNGLGRDRKLLHGLFTYDYFAIIRTLHPGGSGNWLQPSEWTAIQFPLAFVVFGEAGSPPWQEEAQ